MSRMYVKNCTGGPEAKKNSEKASQFSAFLSRLIFKILLLGFLAVSAYILFFSEYLKIEKIDISGTKELGNQAILDVLTADLSGKFFGLVPKNNFLLVPPGKVERLLAGNFRKIRSVSVTKRFPDSISIQIDERKALLIWCGGGGCFLLDENGMAYNEADFNSPELIQNNLVRIDDASGQEIKIGRNIVSPAYGKYVLTVKDGLEKYGFAVNGYFTPSAVAEEIDVKTEQGAEIYFSTQFSLESALHTLGVILEKEIPKDQKEKLEYIDLRSENKVFYKFKGEENNSENQEEKN
jgi:cell division septal protein FtsQ